MMPYRSAQPPKPDREPEAAAELRRRATRTRLGSAAACLVVPLAISVPGYFFLEELQFKVIGGIAWPLVSMLVGVCLPIGLGLRATGSLARWILRRRVDPWLDEVSTRYEVPREDLVKYTTPWRM